MILWLCMKNGAAYEKRLTACKKDQQPQTAGCRGLGAVGLKFPAGRSNQHFHIQGFPKTPRAGGRRNCIIAFPPFSDEVCFINVKAFFKKGMQHYFGKNTLNIISEGIIWL